MLSRLVLPLSIRGTLNGNPFVDGGREASRPGRRSSANPRQKVFLGSSENFCHQPRHDRHTHRPPALREMIRRLLGGGLCQAEGPPVVGVAVLVVVRRIKTNLAQARGCLAHGPEALPDRLIVGSRQRNSSILRFAVVAIASFVC